MKHTHLPSIMIFVLLVCLPDFTSGLLAQTTGGSDNPIMVIRCRNFDGEVLKDNKQPTNQAKMMTDCPDGYTATADGGCVPICPPRMFGSETITYTFNPVSGRCEETGCTPDPGTSIDCASYCPGFFSDEITCDPCLSDSGGRNTDDFLTYDSTLGACYKSCFDGEVTFDPPTVNCDSPDAIGNVAVELCFRSTDPTMPLIDGQQIPISDIANCLDELGNAYFDLLPTISSLAEDYGFGTAMNGEICIEFFANPSEPIIINLSNQVEPLEIPICEDPIPTMSQWGLMILALLLSAIGLVFMAKRKMA